MMVVVVVGVVDDNFGDTVDDVDDVGFVDVVVVVSVVSSSVGLNQLR